MWRWRNDWYSWLAYFFVKIGREIGGFHMEKEQEKTVNYDCPRCGGLIIELGVDNEYGFSCDTCNYPYPDDEE